MHVYVFKNPTDDAVIAVKTDDRDKANKVMMEEFGIEDYEEFEEENGPVHYFELTDLNELEEGECEEAYVYEAWM